MPFFDTHTHFDLLPQLTQISFDKLISQSKAVSVEKILVLAGFSETFQETIQLCCQYPNELAYGLGLHPLYIKQHSLSDLDFLEKCLAEKDSRFVAIGEIGLERALEPLITPILWTKQCDFLEAQLALAKKYQLPVNLHSRKAHDQLFPFLKKVGLSKTGVIHGFSGSFQQAKRFVDLGYKIGVGGTITYPRANKTRQTISQLPLDCLVLETDSPDMPINGFQGMPNRPDRLPEVFKVLCELRKESPEQIVQSLWNESMKLFSF